MYPQLKCHLPGVTQLFLTCFRICIARFPTQPKTPTLKNDIFADNSSNLDQIKNLEIRTLTTTLMVGNCLSVLS